jgi:phosphoglycerate dehydrogenase-like enzyme
MLANEPETSMRLAVLDDYQAVTSTIVDWSKLKGVTVVPFTDHVHEEAELVARLENFDAVMRIRERTEFPRSVLEKLPRLKLLLATGMRNARSIDMAAAKELGITVCGTEVSPHTTVELVWAMILGLMRHIPQETASFRAGGWQVGLGSSLLNKTLGVVGLGSMGIPVARVGRDFGMKVVAWSPNLTPARTAEHQVECVSKQDLFARSDVVTLHMPDTDATQGIVGAAEIDAMKNSAYFVNTSRPALVDQEALLKALLDRRIGGAGIDVFDREPLPSDHPYRWLPNVLATPHIGFVTAENYRIFFEQSLENAIAYVKGSPTRVIS